MTLNQLYKRITKLIDAGHGRYKVSIDKSSFSSPEELDGGVIIDVESLRPLHVPQMEGGFHIENKDGSERMSRCIVLSGKK